MATKDIKEKLPTVLIKGKEYVQVKDRVLSFNDLYKNGRITTELISSTGEGLWIVKCTVTPDVDKPNRYFTGYSQANEAQGLINKTSALENCETSAVGRALAMMGIGIIDSVGSADEVKKAISQKTEVVDPTEDWPKEGEQFCKIHNKPMKRREGKNGGFWFDHRWTDSTGAWKSCNGEVTK